MSKGERYALIAALAGLALISAPWFYTQLLVWKAEGHDHMLTVANIVLTLLLWAIFGCGIYKAVKVSKKAAGYQAQIITIRDEAKTQSDHYFKKAQEAEQRVNAADIERRKWQGQAHNNANACDSLKYIVEQHIATIRKLESDLSEAKREADLKSWDLAGEKEVAFLRALATRTHQVLWLLKGMLEVSRLPGKDLFAMYLAKPLNEIQQPLAGVQLEVWRFQEEFRELKAKLPDEERCIELDNIGSDSNNEEVIKALALQYKLLNENAEMIKSSAITELAARSGKL